MSDILLWMAGIVVKTAVVVLVWVVLKTLIRNGGETVRTIIETIGVAIKYGCIKLRKMWLSRLEKPEEKEPEEDDEEPSYKDYVWGDGSVK